MIKELSFLSNICLKQVPTKSAYDVVKSTCNLIGPVDLYCLYLAECTEDRPVLDFKSFYNVLKQDLYYDKYICDHGVEFFYYVSFTDEYYTKNKYLIEYYYNKCYKHMHDTIDVIPAVGNAHSVGLSIDIAKQTKGEKYGNK